MTNSTTPILPKRITLSSLQKMKKLGEKITALTTYDASFARLLSHTGIEILLVGDTLGMVVCGYPSTVAVTMQEMVYHTRNVCRGNLRSLLISDLPFLTYSDLKKTLHNAGRLMQAGAEVVKLEGGLWLVPLIEQLTEKGIPVCTHIGLTPQSVNLLSGYKIQGREPEKAQQLFETALAHEKAGAQILVLECIPYLLAEKITQALTIPVIGIGAGPYCDGQVLVTPDMLGLTGDKPYTFVQNFLMGQTGGLPAAIKNYITQVKSGQFPSLEQSFS